MPFLAEFARSDRGEASSPRTSKTTATAKTKIDQATAFPARNKIEGE
ncbi:hypothetical protein [Xanthomonas arboricola]